MTKPGLPSREARRPLLRRLRNDSSGASAIEFALVAGPFLALLAAIIEVSLVFFGGFTLENAVDQAGRLIRTGQAQAAGMDAAAFKKVVCGRVHVLFDCETGLKVEVQRFETFNGIGSSLGSPLEDGTLKQSYPFEMGNGGDVVVVRAFYEWNLFASLPAIGLSNMDNGSRLMIAATTFRNEPFDN